ncbi:hypothetical protein [Paraliomyxa miuraensis]|uniref:hypothetical protein n=1 Tax=Paraliomyxa miuraensis TaxID=376150 RepID=UPI00225470DC|nr:hypothetical protein [Paraliomyxa miuraensis]MCX4247465.1 hypothetical protein [Paraliomyxa miuraensis]
MSLEIAIYVNRIPAPLLSEAVSEVTVEQMGDGTSRYRVTFETDISRGDFSIVNDPRLQPSFLGGFDNELAIVLRDGVLYKCLINGPIEERGFEGKVGGPGSTFVVTGSDRCVVMDRVDQQRVWVGTEATSVMAILATHKLLPDVEATSVIYDPVNRMLVQSQSDLDFVRQCARRNGFNFWVSTMVPPGVVPPGSALIDVGHFRTAPMRARPTAPPTPPLVPQTTIPVLRLNAASQSLCGFKTTTNQFESTASSEVPYVVTGYRLDENTGAVVPILMPRIPANSIPFGLRPVEAAAGVRLPPPTLQFSGGGGVAEAYARAEAAISEAAFFVRGQVETTREATNALVEPNMFVRVEGTGGENQGQYWVDAVTHQIDSNAHRMSIQLRRNAQGIAI